MASAQRTQSRADNEAGIKEIAKRGLPVNDDVDANAIRKIVEPTWGPLTKDLGANGQELVKLLQAAA